MEEAFEYATEEKLDAPFHLMVIEYCLIDVFFFFSSFKLSMDSLHPSLPSSLSTSIFFSSRPYENSNEFYWAVETRRNAIFRAVSRLIFGEVLERGGGEKRWNVMKESSVDVNLYLTDDVDEDERGKKGKGGNEGTILSKRVRLAGMVKDLSQIPCFANPKIP